MKKLIVMSDTHGFSSTFRRVLEKEREADALIFLGDGLRDLETVAQLRPRLPVYSVQGNCDFACQEPMDGLAPFEGVLIYYTHGHLFGVKHGLEQLAQVAANRGADLALFGHTHMPCRERLGDITLFNPGSAGAPRDGWASYGVITLPGGGVFQLEHRRVPGYDE